MITASERALYFIVIIPSFCHLVMDLPHGSAYAAAWRFMSANLSLEQNNTLNRNHVLYISVSYTVSSPMPSAQHVQ